MRCIKMKKETVLKFLSYSCFLLPGNPYSPRKRWCLSPRSILCILSLIFVILASINEFLGYRDFIVNDNIKAALTKLKHVPPRPIGFCLRPLGRNETLIEVKGENGITVDIVPINSTAEKTIHIVEQPVSDLEDIVTTAVRLLIFTANIIIRVFVLFSFSKLISLFNTVFQGKNEGEDPARSKNGFMSILWYEATQRWSTCEKALLFFILLSELQRELEFIMGFYDAVSSTGLDLLVIPCLVYQAVLEQLKLQLARELVTENIAFFLVVGMKTLKNLIESIAGNGEDDEDDLDDPTKTDRDSFLLDELARNRKKFEGGTKKSVSQAKAAAAGDILFVKTRAMLENNAAVRGISTIDQQIFGIIGSAVKPKSSLSYNSSIGQDTFRTPPKRLYGDQDDTPLSSSDFVHCEINFLVSTYFDLLGIWEEASRLTGLLTLVLFCELTISFCFNTYITMDNAMNYGLFSGPGVNGIVRGFGIVGKLICVCNAAQDLIDMTPILLDRLLKLKLQLLSLPTESYRKSDKISISRHLSFGGNLGRAPESQCERCRGLGSFLSEMVSYIRAHPFELSALGYFTVSRSTLTTITGVIVTYLVVLVQFQSYAASSSK